MKGHTMVDRADPAIAQFLITRQPTLRISGHMCGRENTALTHLGNQNGLALLGHLSQVPPHQPADSASYLGQTTPKTWAIISTLSVPSCPPIHAKERRRTNVFLVLFSPFPDEKLGSKELDDFLELLSPDNDMTLVLPNFIWGYSRTVRIPDWCFWIVTTRNINEHWIVFVVSIVALSFEYMDSWSNPISDIKASRKSFKIF
jgi:hypothetical protein